MELSRAGLINSFRSFWDKLSSAQKAITIIAPLVVASALITLIFWASKPEYVAIFTELSDTDAGAVTEKLKDLGVNYKIDDNGATILVPKQVATETRLKLANSGLPQDSKFSFDYLNEMRIGETESDRRIRYTLGLQNELEITLKTLSGVEDARVHIVIPEESLFAEPEETAKAAVTIERVPGVKITDSQVMGIANLVAASVKGLKAENVSIVDTEGNVYDTASKDDQIGKLTGTQIQYQAQVEEKIEKSVQSMLDRVFGYGKTVVRVSATLDFDQIKIIDQVHGPGAIESRQTIEESSSGSSGANVPGVNSNIPGYPATNGTTSSSNSSSSTENYQVDTRQEERIVSPGAIKRLSLSVMVDSQGIAQGAEGQEQLQNQMDQIRMAVASAAGIDETRGDQIQVAAMPFHKISLSDDDLVPQHPLLANPYLLYAALGGSLLFVVLVLALILRARAKRRRAAAAIDEQDVELAPITIAKAEELLLAQQKAEEEAALRLAQKQAKTAEEIERQKVREAVEKYSKSNPDEVARLIKTWLAEER